MSSAHVYIVSPGAELLADPPVQMPTTRSGCRHLHAILFLQLPRASSSYRIFATYRDRHVIFIAATGISFARGRRRRRRRRLKNNNDRVIIIQRTDKVHDSCKTLICIKVPLCAIPLLRRLVPFRSFLSQHSLPIFLV